MIWCISEVEEVESESDDDDDDGEVEPTGEVIDCLEQYVLYWPSGQFNAAASSLSFHQQLLKSPALQLH